jgi:chromosomal replication initiator protein
LTEGSTLTVDPARALEVAHRRKTVPAEKQKNPERESNQATTERIQQELMSHLGEHKYDMWFGGTRLRLDDDRLEVATASPFVAKWIDTQFVDDLRGIAERTTGGAVEITVKVADDPSGAPSAPRTGARQTARERADAPESIGRHMRTDLRQANTRRSTVRRAPVLRRLDDVVIGPGNRLALTAAKRLVEEQNPSAVSPLFIHSDTGLGKTHLLQGICRAFADRTSRPQSVRYVTAEQFTNEYVASIRANTIDAFRNRIRKLDLLAMDDVHFLVNKVRTQGELMHTLDEIGLIGARVVMAADEHPRAMKKFSQALISRFLSGMVVQIDAPDLSTRTDIVRRLAAARGLAMQDAAVETIAGRCVGSVRELEGTLTKLAALQTIANDMGDPPGAPARGEVGMVLVEQLFKDHDWRPRSPIRIATVIDTVCARLGISRVDLMGSSRHRRVVLGRALVAYLSRDMTTHSYPEIARALGRSYHSTIHTAEQRLKRQIAGKETCTLGDGAQPMLISELAEQVRHEIARNSGRG